MKRALPKVGDEGMATHRGLTFPARVLTIITGRDGPALVVTAVRKFDWHKLPASGVVVPLDDFTPRLPPCPNCGQRHGADSHGCTDGG